MTDQLWPDERIDGFANRIPFDATVVAAWMYAMRNEYEAERSTLQARIDELEEIDPSAGVAVYDYRDDNDR